jgi:alpha-glucosidase
MENAKWANDDFPGYDATIPFIRMLAGPLDYTPGAMKNYNKANFRAIFGEPMSQGTRCHQLAMYIVYEAPFSMLVRQPHQLYAGSRRASVSSPGYARDLR